MKIAFQGFRGFGKKYEFLEISDLTILTGKNSSGKSTFIKLLKLLCEAFEGVNNLQDLVNIKINIATEIIGGKESLKSLQKVSQAKFVFTTKFEFFIDYHEIHINFEISNYILEVKTVEIFDEASLKTISPLLTIYSEIIKLNTKKLFLRYNKFAILYNIFEEYRHRTEQNNWKSDNKIYQYKFDKIREELGLTDENILKEIDNHISPNQGSAVISELTALPNNEDSHPFEIVEFMQGGWYQILAVMHEKFEYSRQEVEEIIQESEFHNEVNSFIQDVKIFDPSYDFITQFLEWYDYELENFFISNKDFTHDSNSSTNRQLQWLTNGFFEFQKDGIKRKGFVIDDENTITLECGQNLIEKIVNSKFHLLYYLNKVSGQIYQKYILQFIKSLSNSKFQSNVRNLPERSYNIFHSDSIFSAFIKQWKILDKRERERKIRLIKSYLNKFEIADDINVKFENNMGFIQLLKKGNSFSIIDEGSGVSNILSCLLFIAQNIVMVKGKKDQSDSTIEDKQILVFEEPESNLHPSLQSLLADLFVDIITKYNMRLIIETHSEYFIRKLQFLVAKKKVQNNSISLNYFDISYPKNSPVISFKRIPISKDGILEDEFGPGFFDEANNLSINLFQLNQTQNN